MRISSVGTNHEAAVAVADPKQVAWTIAKHEWICFALAADLSYG